MLAGQNECRRTLSRHFSDRNTPVGSCRKIAGLRILITGASQGIGRALAVEAARQGAKVLATARSAGLLDELGMEIRHDGGTIETLKADVTSAEERQRMVEVASQRFGGLDVLINNAGIGATGHFAEVSPDRLRQIMEVNFFGLAETTRVCLPLLRQGVTPAIVNISSIAGRRALPARSEYSASKFAVQGLSEALRGEMVRFDIDVIVINPGLTQTNFSQNMIEQRARMPLDHLRGMSATAVALATMRALERGQEEVTLTLKGKLIVWFTRFFPRLVDRLVKRKVGELFRDEIVARKRKLDSAAATAPARGQAGQTVQ